MKHGRAQIIIRNSMFKKFNTAEIGNTYKAISKNSEYLSKYDTLTDEDQSFLHNTLSHPLYRWDARDYPRVRTVLDFREWMEKYGISPNHLAYTDADDPELKLLEHKESTLLKHDASSGVGDLHELDDKLCYDFFLFNQTLEHLYNPFIAVKKIYDSLVPKGYVFTSVPTINIPHMTPMHFNGLNPMGLAMVFQSCGFEIIETGQWGNYEYLTKLFAHHSWPGYKDLSPNGIMNEERNVISCWVLAQKPEKES